MPQFRDPNEKRDFMLNTPIPRLVPKMALPSIAGMLVTSAYNLADTLFVSQLGTDATGAVGVNGSIDLIIMMAGSLLAVGAASPYVASARREAGRARPRGALHLLLPRARAWDACADPRLYVSG